MKNSVDRLYSLRVVAVVLAVFAVSLSPLSADPYIKPEIKSIIHNIFENRKQYLTDLLDDGLGSGDTYALYDTQLYTMNLLHYAVEMQDEELINDLAEIYLTAYSHLQTKNRYIYYYWPGDTYQSVHNVVDENGTQISAPMWLGPDNADLEYLGQEIVLSSSQFLFAVTRLCNAILDIDANDRTTSMNTFITNYVPVIVSHYDRWVFSANGVFQVKGWGGPSGLYNHQDFMQAKVDGDFGDDPSYLEVITDIDMWVTAGVVELLAANDRNSTLVPLDSTLKNNFLSYVDTVTDFTESRISYSNLTKFDNSTAVTGANFELGYWDDHSGYAYSGYTGATTPLGLPECPADNVGWDISHARRFVEVFGSFYKYRSVTGQTFPSLTVMQRLSNQLFYGAFNKDLDEPLATNFMDGTNGWYRVGYTTGFPGYAPYELSGAVFNGGYLFWSEFNTDAASVGESFWDKVNSLYAKDASGHLRHCVNPVSTLNYGAGNPCVLNRYLNFDGATCINPGKDQAYAVSEGSIEFWFKPSSSAEQDMFYIGGSLGYNDYLLVRKKADNTILLLIEENNIVKTNLTTTGTCNVGKWNHLVITQDGTGAKIYINGSLASPTNSSAYLTGHLYITRFMVGNAVWTSHYFTGGLDDLHLYSKALTATEVAANYQMSRLIANWTFDVAESCQTNTTTTTTGIIGDGAAFNGTNQYILAYADGDMASATGSVSLWFKPSSSSRQEPLLYIREDSYQNYFLIRKKSDDTILLLIEDDDVAQVSLTTSETVNINQWNHLVVTQDGTGAKIYLNGALATVTGTNSGCWTDHLTINVALIGRASWSPAYYQGAMDEIKICQGAMTAGDVSREYCAGTGDGKKLIDWTFDSGDEQYYFSNVGSASDGAILNAASFNGTNQYLLATADPELASPEGSVSLWFKPSSASRQEPLVYIREDQYQNYFLIRKKSDDKILLLIEDNDVAQVSLTTSETVNIDQWNHLVVTQDGTGAKIYLNGALATVTGTNSGCWTDHLTINVALIGRASWVPAYYLGEMDELQIRNHALSQNEVSREYRRKDMLTGWDLNEIQDDDVRTFISTCYGTDFDAADSLDLLMILPGFLEL